MASELWLKALSLLMAILVCELEGSSRSPCPTSPSLCFQPPIRGFCRAYFRRYYFDSKSGKCKMFIYGGCSGNRNNFRDKKSCDQTCAAICPGGGTNSKPTPAPTTAPTRPKPTICPAILRGLCTLPPVKGPCRARKTRFYYDQRTNQCRMFIYGDCRGNGNNFKTKKRRNDYDNGYPFD
ncbi:BPTI/Kunitz domain-containing protein-like [Porites lutea]|uniref:BPTI/Kunitz domain-containing protein-like n=1 Tax=Porites lutea TaxID=51062 RepID=UPI003CC53BC9